MNIEITYGKKTKRKIIIHNRDLWALDTNLAHIIYKCLVKYKKTQGKDGVGYPTEFDSQYEKAGDDTYQWSQEQQNIDILRWMSALDKMIYAFESIAKDRFMEDTHEKEFDKECEQIHKLYKKKSRVDAYNSDQMSEVYHKYDPYIMEHKQKVKEGLELFAQHFESLWV